jgi:hypothetical protein
MSTTHHPQTDGQTERVNQSIECYLRCFISSHPQNWAKWLALCEFWYNTNWHSSLGKSPFEILYGRQPRYFGVTATDAIAPADVQDWLRERSLMLASVRQHLLRMQQRMKHQADKNRTERSFEVGVDVFLRLQPYMQHSVERITNHKLSYKFFGPFKVLERVGAVAYRLALPPSSKIHPVFHVSQLKQCIRPGTPVATNLPPADAILQVPVKICRQRVRQLGHRMIPQVEVQWSGASPEQATWEDLAALRQQFPFAPAWGQAGFQGEGIVSEPARSPGDRGNDSEARPRKDRPRREKRVPARLDPNTWVV